MVVRTATFAGGVESGASALGLTPQEVYLANVPNLVFWPYINAAHGIITEQGATRSAFIDRMSDVARYNFDGLGGNVNAAVSSTAEGSPAINMGSGNTRLRYTITDDDPNADFSKGITFGVVVNGKIGLSAANSVLTSRLNCDGAHDENGGAIILRGRTIASAAIDYTGPALSTTEDRHVIFTLDPVAGQITLDVDGVYTQTLVDGTLVGFTAHPGQDFAQVNDTGVLTSRNGPYGGCVIFNRALDAAERSILMDYLLSI